MIHWHPKKKTIIVFPISFVVTAFFLIRAFSFDIAIWFSGFRPDSVEVLSRGYSDIDNNQEVQIVKAETSDGSFALLEMKETDWGFWVCYPGHTTKQGTTLRSWSRTVAGHTFGRTPVYTEETHHIYYGNNAIKQIAFLPEQIPPNVTVNIQQTGNEYILHIVSFADADTLNGFHEIGLLYENGCLED